MKKNLQEIALFSIILVCLIYGVQWAVESAFRHRVKHKFTKIFNSEVNPEIMIFGSSVAYHQFDPELIKVNPSDNVYNMGWDGVFFVQYRALIKQFLTYQTNCKVLVMACDFDNLGKNELITRPDLMLAYLNNQFVYNALREIEPANMLKARFVPGYKLTLLNKAFYKDIFFAGHNEDKRKGYDPVDIAWDATDSVKPFMARYNDTIFAELKQTIDEITAKGIKVVIVMTPVYREGYKLISNAEEIKNKYRSLVKKNVYYFDYTTDSICSSKEYFHNYSHLNKTGATLFSNNFAAKLRAL